jgi:photosystem II stability/assembly factor-like uncharacterized protein
MKILYFLTLIIIQALFTTFNIPDKEIFSARKTETLRADSTNVFAPCGEMIFTSGKKGLFYSEDQGLSWKKQKNFPDVKAVKISSRDTELFVLTDHNGLYYSIDCGKTWETIERVFENEEGMSMSEKSQQTKENIKTGADIPDNN